MCQINKYIKSIAYVIFICRIIFICRKEGARCPVDSRPLKSESDLFRDLYTSREILQQRTPCPYHRFGCEITLSPVDMETHVNQCVYKRSLSNSQNIYCHFKSVGCVEAFSIEEDLHAHLAANTNLHLTVSPVFFNLITFNRKVEKIITYLSL